MKTTTDNRISENPIAKEERPTCAVETTIAIIGGRWKVLILRELLQGTKRFNELHRSLNGITQKMLTQQLREMEDDGIIHREVYLQVPPKVEYSLTSLGQTLQPILEVMHDWGQKYLEERGSGIGDQGSGIGEEENPLIDTDLAQMDTD